jgi:hypothetical protein
MTQLLRLGSSLSFSLTLELDVRMRQQKDNRTLMASSRMYSKRSVCELTMMWVKQVTLCQLLRPETERHTPWWSWLGAVCGGGIGFIIANVPGLMLGAFAGNRLGAIRDAKGKSVASVFNELGGQQKAEVTKSISLDMLLLMPMFDVMHRFSVLWL